VRILVHESTLDAAGATRRLRGEELGRLGLAHLLGRQPPDRLRAVDLVLVPHWYVSFRVVVAAARGEHVAPALWTMLDTLGGTVLRLPTPPPLVERELADLAPAVALPPRLGRDEAVAAAREGLRWDVRARGHLRVTPRSLDPREIRLGYVPFWVGYYEGREGQLRARALHGVEGSVQTAQFSRELLRTLEAVG
jgi:hypothetical protein